MNPNTDNNKSYRPNLQWTKPDGTVMEGTFDEVMLKYYQAGKVGEIVDLSRADKKQMYRDFADALVSLGVSDDPREAFKIVNGYTKSKGWGKLTEWPNQGWFDKFIQRLKEKSDKVADFPWPKPSVTVEVVGDAAERRFSTREDWTAQVHEDDKAAALEDMAKLRALGLTPGRPMVALGSTLIRYGVDKWSTQRTELSEMPSVEEAAGAVIATIEAEQRRDIVVNRRKLRLENTSDGLTLHAPQTEPVRIERNGIQMLSRFLSPVLPHAGFVSTMLASEIVELFNSRQARGVSPTGDIKLRTRDAVDGAGRSLWAVTGPKYASFDSDIVARVVADVHRGSNGTMVYNPDRGTMEWEIASMRDLPPVVGEVFKIVQQGRTSDTGNGSVQSWTSFWRALCYNLTTETLDTNKNRTIHRGDVRRIVAKARQEMRAERARAFEAFPEFAQRREVLASTSMGELFEGKTLSERVESMCLAHPGVVDAASMARDALVQIVLDGMAAEGVIDDASLAQVIDGLTRIHRQKVPVLVRQAVQQQAGALGVQWARQVTT